MTQTTESLYEQICPLTKVMRQHFVEWFTEGSTQGSDAPEAPLTNRWDFGTGDNSNGSGTYLLSKPDGTAGLNIKTEGASGSNFETINFGRSTGQFDPEDSTFICVYQPVTSTKLGVEAGLWENSYFTSSYNSDEDYYRLAYRNDTIGTSATASDVATDTSYHVHKGSTNGTKISYYLDGILKVTATYPIPSDATGTLEPYVQVRNVGATGVKEANIAYFEAWNN